MSATSTKHFPPSQTDAPEGKLRLLYEANPIAFIAEQAGGQATDGRQRILDIQPESIHERTPLIVGGEFEISEFQSCVDVPVVKRTNSNCQRRNRPPGSFAI